MKDQAGKRLFGCFLTVPLGCMAFFVGAVVVAVVTMPLACGRLIGDTAEDEFHFQQDAKGAWIYFTSFRPGGLSNAGDIWATLPDGRGGYGDAVNLGPAVNRPGVPNVCPAFMPNGTMAQFTMDVDGEIDIYVNDVV